MLTRTLVAILVGAMLLVGVVGYQLLRPAAGASSWIHAVPLELESSTAVTSPGDSAASGSFAAGAVFTLDPERSQARFVMDEVLRGAPNTVTGTTAQVAGQIAVDLTLPAGVRVSTILINARTLETGDSQRDRMLQRFILGTDQHEYISFSPTALTGLPATVAMGQPYSFQINGQLMIRDVTRHVTFDATVTAISPDELAGSASTSIHYVDWNISIPQVPFVASVSDQVRLELDFVAIPA